MTHYVCLVALPAGTTQYNVEEVLSKALAPFDENLEVAPYMDGGEETTYNPDSKWDWYQIGGRWSGYFPFDRQLDGDPRLILGSKSWFNHDEPVTGVDGGPISLLDLDKRRDERADSAGKLWDKWAEFIIDLNLPDGKPWSHFYGRVNETYTLDQARQDYGEQPVIHAARSVDEWRWRNDPVAEFCVSREEYVQRARNSAVGGCAYLDLEGKWHEPGVMGWFATTTATAESENEYFDFIAQELDSLDPDTVLVAVDLHI